MKQLLVIGGTGMVGRHLVPRLLDAGHRVTLLSRGNRRPAFLSHPELSHVVLDRTDLHPTHLPGRFDAVIDNVAYTPEAVQAVFHALDGRMGAYIVLSTAFVTPQLEHHFMHPDRPVKETDYTGQEVSETPQTEHDHYVAGKRALEAWLLAATRAGQCPPVTIMRPALQIMGPFTDDARFAWFWLRVRDGGPVWLPEEARLTPPMCQVAYAGDVAQALVRAVKAPSEKPLRTYLIAQPERWDYAGFLAVLADCAGKPVEIRYASQEHLNASPFADTRGYRLPLPYPVSFDLSAIERDLQVRWTPFAAWVQETATWVDQHYAAASPPAWYARRAAEKAWVLPTPHT